MFCPDTHNLTRCVRVTLLPLICDIIPVSNIRFISGLSILLWIGYVRYLTAYIRNWKTITIMQYGVMYSSSCWLTL